MLKENSQSFGLFSVILDNNARAANNLAGVTLIVDLAKTSPLAQLLGLGDLDEVDVVLKAQGLNELHVGGLRAVGSQSAQVSLSPVQGLSALMETTSKTIVNQSFLQDLLHWCQQDIKKNKKNLG